MNIELFREYCLSKKEVNESFPFNKTTLVMKVFDKMFALANLEGELRINLKSKPEQAIELRETYQSVSAGYHMNKKHWNTIKIDGSIKPELIKKWIDDSYYLVAINLKKVQKDKLDFDIA